MTIDLSVRRRVFAEEIEAVANLKTGGLAEALALVPREDFLRPGPWFVFSDADVGTRSVSRQTADADPRHVYHNYSIAIEPARQLFNGTPGLIARLIDVLALEPGSRVLHIGAGLGYYSALIARTVTSSGRVVAIEVEPELASQAKQNLAAYSWVEVKNGDGSESLGASYDAILVNAGVTHPQQAWLDALAPNGKLMLPMTATVPAMAPIGKGLMVLLTKGADAGSFEARAVTFVAIYSAVGLRDEAGDALIAAALQRAPFPPLKRLRLDPHAPGAGCWLHAATFCFATV